MTLLYWVVNLLILTLTPFMIYRDLQDGVWGWVIILSALWGWSAWDVGCEIYHRRAR